MQVNIQICQVMQTEEDMKHETGASYQAKSLPYYY